MRLSTELTVDLGLLSSNFELLKTIAPKNEIIFMVKANAYGHGLLEIVYHAFHEANIRRFGCACLGEALQIRKAFPEMSCELWVFSDSNLNISESKELYLDNNIIPVIHNELDLKFILENKDFTNLPLVLKFDTGMNRLGLDQSRVENVISMIKAHARTSVFHLMTHFANSYLKLKNNDKTQKQYAEFLSIKNRLKNAGISIEETSCSNSGAIEQGFGLEETHIRPGLMLYGPAQVINGSNWSGKTISKFRTEVLKISSIKKGTPIGYGSHICGYNGHIIHLPIGYGDGILTYYSGQTFKSYEKDAKIMGRVNMDITSVFFHEVPKELARGSEFVIWGNQNQDIVELATRFKTTPYQLFTAITNRVPRRYTK